MYPLSSLNFSRLLLSLIRHVLKPETSKRNRRNETTGTTGTTGTTETTGTAGTEPPKPPEQPKRNHQNNRNKITGNTFKRSHISSAGSFRRHNFNSSPLTGDKR